MLFKDVLLMQRLDCVINNGFIVADHMLANDPLLIVIDAL